MITIFCPIAPSTPRELITVRTWGEFEGFINWLGSEDESGRRESAFADLRKTDVEIDGSDPATNLAFIEKTCGGFLKAVFQEQGWGPNWLEPTGNMYLGRLALHRFVKTTGRAVFEDLLSRVQVPDEVILELRESFERDATSSS